VSLESSANGLSDRYTFPSTSVTYSSPSSQTNTANLDQFSGLAWRVIASLFFTALLLSSPPTQHGQLPATARDPRLLPDPEARPTAPAGYHRASFDAPRASGLAQ